MSDLPCSPPAERNKQPILERLRELLPERGTALEVASGTGQHAVWFAAALPQWVWQPTEANASALPGIAAHVAAAGVSNVRPALQLDVMAPQWPAALQPDGLASTPPFSTPFDAVYCANMLHISPWATCAALMQGSARHLAPQGMLVLYGPYLEDDVTTSPGNLAFDESLRAKNPAWGLRRLADVTLQAQRAGLSLRQRHAMPANNLLLVFARSA